MLGRAGLAGWSAEHCELPPGEAAAKLCAAFLSLVERDGAGDPEPVHCKATRWRFAFPTPDDDEDQLIYGGNQNEPGREIRREQTKKTPYVFDPSLMLGACGDWASGPGAGDAYESGAALGAVAAKRHRRWRTGCRAGENARRVNDFSD